MTIEREILARNVDKSEEVSTAMATITMVPKRWHGWQQQCPKQAREGSRLLVLFLVS